MSKPKDMADVEQGWPVFWPEDVPVDAAETAEEVETGNFNWAAFNAKQQRKVQTWVSDKDMVGHLLTMLQCVLPICKLMHQALKMSKAVHNQVAEQGDVAPESTDGDYLIRLREAVTTCRAAIDHQLHDMPSLLHLQPSQIPDLQLLAFRLLARGGACMHKLLLQQYLDMTPFSMLEANARGNLLR